jgi:hypothetical protein
VIEDAVDDTSYMICDGGSVSSAFPGLSEDASQASETLVSVVAVMRRLLGVLGGVRSFARLAALTLDSRTNAAMRRFEATSGACPGRVGGLP